jgi:hypothetical protein
MKGHTWMCHHGCFDQHGVESDDFLLNTVTGDESSFHHFDPEMK